MDVQDTRHKASVLLSLLQKYAAENGSATSLLKVLSPVLQRAIAGQLHADLEWKDVPGDRTFDETDARTLPGLEKAYADFKFAVTGGEPDFVRALRERRGY